MATHSGIVRELSFGGTRVANHPTMTAAGSSTSTSTSTTNRAMDHDNDNKANDKDDALNVRLATIQENLSKALAQRRQTLVCVSVCVCVIWMMNVEC